jgi:hypothetical protein
MKPGFLGVAILLLAGCGSVIRQEFLDNGTKDFDFMDPDCGSRVVAVPREAVEVRYLGSGGVYIRWGDEAILIGPYFSRPGLVRPLLGNIAFDEARIAQGMAGHGEIRAILAGHSHFDHIGDVPFVVQKYAPKARVYLNDAGVHALAAYPDIEAVSFEKEHDQWISIDASIRFMPVPSDHAPQLCKWHHWPCTYADGPDQKKWTNPWAKEKLHALHGGNTFAFVIDLLGASERDVRYRIYYNDAASSPGKGIPRLDDGHPYDLAILCMASFDLVKNYPEAVLDALAPRHVLVSHYDDFFAKQSGSWSFVPLLTDAKANAFFSRLKKKLKAIAPPPQPPLNFVCGPQTELWSMPVPHWTLFFRPSKGKA